MRTLGVVGTLLVGLLVVVRRGLLVAHVRGGSMTPTYLDGERLLAIRCRWHRRLRAGDVVVCRLPDGVAIPGTGDDALLVKRVAALAGERSPAGTTVPPGTVYVLGDAPRHSVDSGAFGPLPLDLVVGVVVRRLTGQSR